MRNYKTSVEIHKSEHPLPTPFSDRLRSFLRDTFSR